MVGKPHFELRPLAERDIETVAGYECEIAKISFAEDPILDPAFYIKKLSKIIADPNAKATVAEAEQRIIGWAHLSVRQNFITKESYGDFHSVYVDPSVRGTGVVDALITDSFAFCERRSLERIVFRVRASNEPMKSVLARYAFAPKQIYYERVANDINAAGDDAS